DDIPADDKGKFSLVIKGDQATVEGNEAIEKDYARIKVKLDPTTTPRCVDLTVAAGGQLNVVLEGIYELKEDELRLCVKVIGKERPVEFAAPAGSSTALIVLKRSR